MNGIVQDMKNIMAFVFGYGAAIFWIIAILGFSHSSSANQINVVLQTKLNALRKEADQGDARAQYHLGLSYATGQGVLQDYAEALFIQKPARNCLNTSPR